MNADLHSSRKKTYLKILFSIVVILLLIRLILPYTILHYAEYRLNKIPEYQATIGDVDVHLYKGSYVIKDLQLKKVNRNIPVPFFSAKAIVLGVEWAPLLKGKFVAQIDDYDPNVSIWSVIINLLKNAFIQALLPQIDNTVELKDVSLND